ncbi:helix-turn-helix domain-containing protein [Nocardia arthritidis]|uniref:Helix-turn-helix domain-containing protein n=1 Tax=Nocardia arthritidis TaxID=228602 RepID=A0A6G9YS74_9NOCA|nr:helix-turn-helix domain-containing protein [Nocardia arthritidis]QIS16054.1 helix-turn-helix domain-containing protein [Nocardia arthritidis]
MITTSTDWRIERNDRVLRFATGNGIDAYGETRAMAVGLHCHPVRKLVLPISGTVVLDGAHLPGVVVPPQLIHSCATTSGFVTLLVEPWRLSPVTGVVPLDGGTVRRLLDALGDEWDFAAAYSELSGIFGAGPALDPRLGHVLRSCGHTGGFEHLAREIGLSAPRLRALVRSAIGVPLSRIRQWQRLRVAVGELAHRPLAESAALAGFADQSHLTRTAQRLLGRTPGSLGPG